MKIIIKCCKILPTLRYERLALSRGRKGGLNVDCFIDDGPSKIGLASTIVKVVDGVPHILRQGSISIDEINSVIN